MKYSGFLIGTAIGTIIISINGSYWYHCLYELTQYSELLVMLLCMLIVSITGFIGMIILAIIEHIQKNKRYSAHDIERIDKESFIENYKTKD